MNKNILKYKVLQDIRQSETYYDEDDEERFMLIYDSIINDEIEYEIIENQRLFTVLIKNEWIKNYSNHCFSISKLTGGFVEPKLLAKLFYDKIELDLENKI